MTNTHIVWKTFARHRGKGLLGLFAVALPLIVISACDLRTPVCGDGVCGLGENLLCPQDCPVDPTEPICGNNQCEAGENVSNCPGDCGTGQVCGNGTCGAGENSNNCAADCGPTVTCGDSTCDPGETAASCPADCMEEDCNPGCPQEWIADSFCDFECFNAACNFDEGDCDPQCSPGCPEIWVGDEFCDEACLVAACAFDLEDCGPVDDAICGDGICSDSESVSSCPTDCDEVTDPAGCGDNVCDAVEDASSCPEDCADVARYIAAVQAARIDRDIDSELGVVELGRGDTIQETNQAGNKITEFIEVTNKRTAALDKLVMTDNTIGKIYPGSILWAEPIRDGRLNQLEQIPDRPLVTTSFDLIEDIEPRPQAIVFDHNGSYSGFLQGAAPVFNAVGSGGSRLSADFKISTSVEDALLSIGVSANFWSGSASAGLDKIEQTQRSVAVMTFDQVFYSAAMDIPGFEGLLPTQLLMDNADLARNLADGVEQDGELVYVRKVDYGRRILVSLSAEASSTELDLAMDLAVRWVSGDFSSELDARSREVWDSIEGKMIIIGGKFPEGVNGFFSGNFQGFVDTIQAIMQADFVNDSEGAVPVAFELAYLNDNSPMQVFETTEFAGKIPGRSWGLQTKGGPSGGLYTGPGDARVIAGDGEIDADDWTLLLLERQKVFVSQDRKKLMMDLQWSAREGTGSQGFKDTWIRSQKTITLHSGNAPIRSFLPPNSDNEIVNELVIPSTQRWLRGDLTNIIVPTGISRWGYFTNIRVKVDRGGSSDQGSHHLWADGDYRIWFED